MQEKGNPDYHRENTIHGTREWQPAPGVRQYRPPGPGTQQQGAQTQQQQQGVPAQYRQQVQPGAVTPQEMMPVSLQSPYLTAGYLRSFIGKTVSVQFSFGTTGALVDRNGQLMEVGANYIVIKEFLSDLEVIGDLFSVKFVTVYPQGIR